MAAGDVASISGLGSGLRSDCEAGLPTETGSDLIGAGAFDILRRKVPSAREPHGPAEKRCGPLCRVAISIPPSIEFYHVLGAIAQQQGAQALDVKLIVLNASNEAEIETAFAEFSRQRITALLLGTDVFFLTRRDQIVALANRLRIATMYDLREYVVAGGLISYAPSIAEVYRQAGIYVAKVLKGAKPADLPVVQPTKFDLVPISRPLARSESKFLRRSSLARMKRREFICLLRVVC